ncbi:hypothetical protein B0T10DRAFT_559347 [Thelonectria olida]|uniref:DUF7719 domain-containing protein n=1 Tax=Thelonectria olida TaxID=1576542 RepID=A0A9P9ASE5_9HYPO|nr:hypothetical protein B0T10DRAFT_559347 [Thelonectria olida]
MARQRKEPKNADKIKLKQPDRSAPSEKTLLDMASDRNLFAQADARMAQLAKEAKRAAGESDDEEDEEDQIQLSPGAERFLEAMLWTFTLAIIHFTFEVLVQSQYGMDIEWPAVWGRTARAWTVFIFIFYPLHPHDANPKLVPYVPQKYQHHIRQFIFFAMSLACGPYLIHISNRYGYMAVMKRAPPLGCLWLWSIVELDLVWAVLSLSITVAYSYKKGYTFK